MRLGSGLSAAMAVSLMLVSALPAHAQSGSPEELAHERYLEGRAAYEIGDYELAARLLTESLAAFVHPNTLLTLGLTEQHLGNDARAVDFLERYLAGQPENADSIQARLRRLRTRPALAIIVTEPPGALVFLDGEAEPIGATPLRTRIALGEHRIRIVRDGFAVVERTEEVVFGRPLEIVLQLEATGSENSVVRDLTPSAAETRFGIGIEGGLILTGDVGGGSPPVLGEGRLDLQLEIDCGRERACLVVSAMLGMGTAGSVVDSSGTASGSRSLSLDALFGAGVRVRLSERWRVTVRAFAGLAAYFGIGADERLSWWPSEARLTGGGNPTHAAIAEDIQIGVLVHPNVELRLPVRVRQVFAPFERGYTQVSFGLGATWWL